MNSQFLDRMIRASKLDVSLYEEVEADQSTVIIKPLIIIDTVFSTNLSSKFKIVANKTTLQAAGVVVLSSLAAGVGALSLGASNFLMAPILSLVSWYIWA